MITGIFYPEINDINLNGIWFQQDGFTSHFENEIIQLKTKINGRGISGVGDVI